jgi:hypothetical protein
MTHAAARYLAACKSGTATLQKAHVMAKPCNSLLDLVLTALVEDLTNIKRLCTTTEQLSAVDNLLTKTDSYCRQFDGLETE